MLLIPCSFAEDTNSTSDDYYFNASAETDGDGSADSPYKYLTCERIKSNSNIYLADGNYELDGEKNIDNVHIKGCDVNKTIIRYGGVGFNVLNSMTIENITLKDISITNNAKLTVINSIFKGGSGSKTDKYGNNYGGAIYTSPDYYNAVVSIDNVLFQSTCAEYGGAIYMGAGKLNISNSLFFDIHAYNYGGAVVCENYVDTVISDTCFINTYSINDAGGAIYIKTSSLKAININITNCSGTFGGAVVLLKSNAEISYLSALNNHAEWDGGAIYQMYGRLTLNRAYFNNNSAKNGGALFADAVSSLVIQNNQFTANTASNTAGAVYSSSSVIDYPFEFSTFIRNKASVADNYFILSDLNLTIADGNYTMYCLNRTGAEFLPAHYNLADHNLVTPVKNQQTSGTCWAFSTLASLESCILKVSGDNLDLSEENMKNIITLYSDYGWNLDNNEGGYNYMPIGYLTGWLGPVNETADIFDDKSALSPLLNSIMHIQNIVFLKRDNQSDNDEIKRAILEYGAVASSIYFDDFYFNDKTNSYCSYDDYPFNHAVAIVGWDDNYSRNNFLSVPEGDGAWIVKNSWGDDWGDGGYFYVSYYDYTFAITDSFNPAYTFILNDTVRYDKNYQYDIQGMTDYFKNESSCVWYKNIFTAGADEFLAGVSTYFLDETFWNLSVFVNDILKLTKNGISAPGYYTIPLENFIELNSGDVFEVVFTISVDGGAAFPISQKSSLNKLTYKPEISYYSYDGINWIDLYNTSSDYRTSQVACIKAFTFLNEIETSLTLNLTDPYNIRLKITDEYANLISNKNLTLILNDEKSIMPVINGEANYSVLPNKIHNNITVIFNSTGYKTKILTDAFEVAGIPIDLKLNITKSSNNVQIIISSEGNINTTFKLKITDETYIINLTDSKAVLNLSNLTEGFYSIELTCNPESIWQFPVLHDNFTIVNTKIIAGNFTTKQNIIDYYNITLTTLNGDVLKYKEIIFTLNNTTVTGTTDENGVASLPVNLTFGSYLLNILFKGDSGHVESSLDVNIIVKRNVSMYCELNRTLNNVTVKVLTSDVIDDNVIIKINDKVYNVKSNITLTDLSNGQYNLSINLNRDAYDYEEISSEFIINVTQPVIAADDLLTYYRSMDVYKITLRDENSSPLSNRLVIFELNGQKFLKVTDNNGEAFINLDMVCGDFDVKISFEGDNDYLKSEEHAKIHVISTFIFNDGVVKTVNSLCRFKLLEKDGNPLINTEVLYKINNLVYSTMTDSVGYLNIDLNKIGSYNVEIINSVNNESFSKTINVISRIAKNHDLSIYEYSGYAYKVLIFDDNGKAAGGESVSFTVAGKIYHIKTDKNGYAILKINLKANNYVISVNYKGFKVSNKLTVKSLLKAKDLSLKKAKSYKFRVRLLNKNGGYSKAKKIKFRIKGKTFIVKTNSRGIATLNIKIHLKVGKYKIYSSYGKSAIVNTLRIRK